MKKVTLLFTILVLSLVSCANNSNINSNNYLHRSQYESRSESQKKLKFTLSQTKKNLSLDQQRTFYKLFKSRIKTAPCFVKGIMYSIDIKGIVYAYSTKDKKVLWQSESIINDASNKNPCIGGIVCINNKLYITNNTRYVTVLDAISGDKIFYKKYPDIIKSTPVIIKDKLLLQTVSNQLITCDIETLEFIWTHKGETAIISTQSHASPLVYNNNVIVSYTSGEIVYIDVDSGKEKWCYNLTDSTTGGIVNNNKPFVISTVPEVSGAYAYLSTSNGKVIKMDLDNGSPAWIKDIDGVHSLSLIGRYILITNNITQHVSILSTHNGNTLWVGYLSSKRYPVNKNVSLYKAFLLKHVNNSFSINVIASDGNCYQFRPNKLGYISSEARVIQLTRKHVQHYWISECCVSRLYLITRNGVLY